VLYACVAFIGVALASAPLRADNTAAAQALFAAGREASRSGDIHEACLRFRESYRLDPATGTRLNLAVCEAKLGRMAVAWQHYTALQSSLAPDDSRRPFVEQRLRELDARLPRVTFEAEVALPAGLTLRANDLVITQSGFRVPIPMDPGTHSIDITAPGHATGRVDLTLEEGDRRTLVIQPPAPLPEATGTLPAKLASDSPPLDSASRRAQPSASTSRESTTWGTVAVGVGVASLVAGSVLGIGALNEKARMERECDPRCSREGLAAADRGSLYAFWSTIGFAGGLALGSVGATLLLWPAPDSAGARGVARVGMVLGGGF
jgi:hypothetical protein